MKRAIVLVAMLVVRPALAQKADATAAFDKALKLMSEGRVAEACAEFEASMRFDPQNGTLYNLARCHEKLGKTATAWSEFEELSRNDKNAARGKDAAKRAAALEPRLVKMHVVVHATPGLVVERDGTDVTMFVGNDEPIDPGKYTFVARAPGHEPQTVVAELTGEGKTVTVELPELHATAATPPPPPVSASANAEYPTQLPLRPLALPHGMIEAVAATTVQSGMAYKNADPIDLVLGARGAYGPVEVEADVDFHVRYNEMTNKPSQPSNVFVAARYVASPMFTLGLEYIDIQPRSSVNTGFEARVIAARKYLVAPKVALIGRAGVGYISARFPCVRPTASSAIGEGDVQLSATERLSFQGATFVALHLGGTYYRDTLGLALAGSALYAIQPQLDAVATAYFPAQSQDAQVYSIALAWRTR